MASCLLLHQLQRLWGPVVDIELNAIAVRIHTLDLVADAGVVVDLVIGNGQEGFQFLKVRSASRLHQ